MNDIIYKYNYFGAYYSPSNLKLFIIRNLNFVSTCILSIAMRIIGPSLLINVNKYINFYIIMIVNVLIELSALLVEKLLISPIYFKLYFSF